MTNRECFRKRVFGEKTSKTFLELLETFLCIRDSDTPLKKSRIVGKKALVVRISKQNNRHKQKKENQPKKQI